MVYCKLGEMCYEKEGAVTTLSVDLQTQMASL